ncbi:DUF4267 domain-containing protein [Sphingomonas sp. PL-96]|uniref:DUF4267 domain-containing protein n=1 Tax=Sphingomonas sp. PL-96 TaxID=2887201 RepID=UPI001E3EC007|nr:DUF4267 domain-containing protein [Sphingomonas sp. PL-96]MCC2978025.1 DUF4267 domain-containing protein [Sphingomonas sp. PL-96]
MVAPSMTLRQPLFLVVCLLAGVFLILGSLFVAMPGIAASIYGFPSRDPAAMLYVRAIGFRDVALAAYLLGLAVTGQRKALSVVLTGTTLIPVGDLLLLASSGAGRPMHYLLHGASLLGFAALALWSRQPGRAP